MLPLEHIQKNAAISGLEPGQVVRIVTTEPVGDSALTAYYKTEKWPHNSEQAPTPTKSSTA